MTAEREGVAERWVARIEAIRAELHKNCNSGGKDCEICATSDEALDAAIRALRQGGGWIAVSERLPDEYGWYHCVVEGVGDLGLARWQEIVSFGHCADFGKRFFTAGGVRATYWKPPGPLPAPPSPAKEG